MDRLQAVLKEKGMTIFARIDHAAGAAKIGYNDPAYVARRHGAPRCHAADKLKKGIAGFIEEALR